MYIGSIASPFRKIEDSTKLQWLEIPFLQTLPEWEQGEYKYVYFHNGCSPELLREDEIIWCTTPRI